MADFLSHSVEETEQFAQRFAGQIHPGDVIALYGGLGMGKTAFVRGFARGLGAPPEEVSSPTFALVHEYEGRMPIYHFDMYRIHSMDDLYSTGFFDYLDSGGVLVIEWSENITAYLPGNRYTVRISAADAENERWIHTDP